MTGAPAGWQAVADLAAIPEDAPFEAAAGRAVVVLVRRGGTVLAFQGLCPHQYARLGRGTIEPDGFLRCPQHLARFSLADGSCGPGWALPPLARYPVRIEAGRVLLPDPLRPLA